MDEFEFMMAFFASFLVLALLGIGWAEIEFHARRRRLNRELCEIDAQIALSGFMLDDCAYGGHQGRTCDATACQAARRAGK